MNPHCAIKSWRFKAEYIRKNRLGPEGRLKAKRKSIAEYEMMVQRYESLRPNPLRETGYQGRGAK